MKKSLIFIALFFLFVPLFSAASIDLKSEYNQGETVIAKVVASFPQGLDPENVHFYKDGHVEVAFDYSVGLVGDFYYLVVSTRGKDPYNYTIKIEDTYYYKAGQAIDDDLIGNLTINDGLAAFEVDPGFFVGTDDFSLDVNSLSDLSISISISTPTEVDSVSSISISPGQSETIDFSLDPPESDLIEEIYLSSQGTSYSVPIHIIGSLGNPECGNDKIDAGELCDGSNWGGITGCEDYGFEKGTLSCREPNTYLSCTFDTSGCYNETIVGEEPECGNDVMESGEQCDGTDWGTIKSCVDFGYDTGPLECTDDCKFDLDKCYFREECKEDIDCKEGYLCNDSNKCEKSDRYCEDEKECLPLEICKQHICTLVDCKETPDCNGNEVCLDYECIDPALKCENDSQCGDRICDHGQCVEAEENPECDKDNPCDGGEECIGGSCVDAEVQNLCSQLGGNICATNKICEGDSSDVDNRTCCVGECKEEGGSNTGKIIGWVLIIAIILGLIFFYFKMKKSKRKNPDLKKIATAPRVKDNLLR